jgi:hypothetical protein
MAHVSRLSLCLVLFSSSAWAVDQCEDYPGIPSGTYNIVSGGAYGPGSCSISGNANAASAAYTSIDALIEAARTNAACAGNCALDTLVYCGIRVDGAGENHHYRQEMHRVVGGALRAANFYLQPSPTGAGGPCEEPETEDEACGGDSVSVGEERTLDQELGDAIWDTVRIEGATWNDAVATVPECITTADGDECTVTGIYKTGPGKDPTGSPNVFSFLADIRMGGGACADAPTSPETENIAPAPKEDGETCETSAAGVEYCHDATPQEDETGCGYYNDNFTCLDAVEPDECWVDADGSRYCGQDAPTPPVPDNGTPGVPAEPDDQIIDPDTDNVYDYYDPDTVTGSDRPAGDSGANPNRPGSTNPSTPTQPVAEQGDGDGDGGEGEGDGSASGGLTCASAPVCDGDAIQCAILDQEWRMRCSHDDPSGIEFGEGEEDGTGHHEDGDGAGAGEISESGSLGAAGSCPAPFNVTVWGTSVEIDVWQYGCDMAVLFAPIVMVLAYLMGGLMLVRGL